MCIVCILVVLETKLTIKANISIGAQGPGNGHGGSQISIDGLIWKAPCSQIHHICPRLLRKWPQDTWRAGSYKSNDKRTHCVCLQSFFSFKYLILLKCFMLSMDICLPSYLCSKNWWAHIRTCQRVLFHKFRQTSCLIKKPLLSSSSPKPYPSIWGRFCELFFAIYSFFREVLCHPTT